MAALRAMPALVVLERFPIPVLAVAEDGVILFANTAFADMVGRSVEQITASGFADVFAQGLPPDHTAVAAMRANWDAVVSLSHADGSLVRARMSKSALLRDEDSVVLTTFQDLTERLWTDEL